MRSKLLADLQKLTDQGGVFLREWWDWLTKGEHFISITFDNECAKENPKSIHLYPTHPLIKQAALALGVSTRIGTMVRVSNSSFPPGDYPFAIYEWQYHDQAWFWPVQSFLFATTAEYCGSATGGPSRVMMPAIRSTL